MNDSEDRFIFGLILQSHICSQEFSFSGSSLSPEGSFAAKRRPRDEMRGQQRCLDSRAHPPYPQPLHKAPSSTH